MEAKAILLAKKSRYRQHGPSLDKQMGSDERAVTNLKNKFGQDGTTQVNVVVENVPPRTASRDENGPMITAYRCCASTGALPTTQQPEGCVQLCSFFSP